MAFDLESDSDEQTNLLTKGNGPAPSEIETLRSALVDGFDYDLVLSQLKDQRREFAHSYPAKVSPKTSNQILLGDGRLVDADIHLEYPNVVSENPLLDFDDWPE